MLFHTALTIIPGKADEMLYKIKKVEVPDEVKVIHFLKLFGKPDFAIIYEASSEEVAMEFILQFVSCAKPETSLATPVEN